MDRFIFSSINAVMSSETLSDLALNNLPFIKAFVYSHLRDEHHFKVDILYQ